MPASRSSAQQAASLAHGIGIDPPPLPPAEDAQELALLSAAVAADWHPRDAYERHWVRELVAALWRQGRLRGLEVAALLAADAESPASEAGLRRLLGLARYGARIDKDLGRALAALRVLQRRADAGLAEMPVRTFEPDGRPAEVAGARGDSCTSEPEPAPIGAPAAAAAARTAEPESAPATTGRPPAALSRQQRRRLAALARQAQRRAA